MFSTSFSVGISKNTFFFTKYLRTTAFMLCGFGLGSLYQSFAGSRRLLLLRPPSWMFQGVLDPHLVIV